jgi:hypothetical protein
VSLVAAVIIVSYFPARMLLPTVVLAGALMGAAYPRFAGLEPLPLTEAMPATDPGHLPGERHAVRRNRP